MIDDVQHASRVLEMERGLSENSLGGWRIYSAMYAWLTSPRMLPCEIHDAVRSRKPWNIKQYDTGGISPF